MLIVCAKSQWRHALYPLLIDIEMLVREWDRLPMDTVRAAIDSWHKRLALVVKHKGGRFE